MRQAQQARSVRTTARRPTTRRARERAREEDAPTTRRRPTDAPTRRETVARTAQHDDVEVDAMLGESLPEPDAPVKTWREMFEDGLRRQVYAVLSDHELADVEISIDGARVVLHGDVRDVLTSQLVEDLAWSVPAVRQCENRLRVAQ